jgi:hypothetical protein
MISSRIVSVRASARKRWLYPIFILGGTAVCVWGGLYTLDRVVAGHGSLLDYFNFDHGHITDSVGGLAGTIAAVLGIIITVVSIIVQLSAERYAQVTEMFFRDRTNLVVMGFYVIGCVCGLFNAFSLRDDFVPRISLAVLVVVAVVGFALMAPYFAYVFDFLQPENIIARIRGTAQKAARAGAQTDDGGTLGDAQHAALSAMEQLTDITINSISGKDKIIATAGVDALKDFGVNYLARKARSGAGWFQVGPRIRENPDFVSMAPQSLDDLVKRKTWVEWKLLRQYQAIYAEALTQMRDINYVIAIDTRYIGEAAIGAEEKESLALCVKFFNSYMRATLNAKDVRTAYNILNQYRQLAEDILRAGLDDKAVEVAGYIKYYGHVSYSMKLAFVTETVAYDLCALCEVAHAIKAPVEQRLLQTFLEVDQPAMEGDVQETGLRGVRKAQVKLATYYLVEGAEPLARRIFEDMRNERAERLRSIRDELLSIETEDFWEVIDRGANFDYLPPARKDALRTFFSWFPRLSGEIPTLQSTTKEAQS